MKRKMSIMPKLTLADKNRFFNEFAVSCGCAMDVSFCRKAYYALLRMMLKVVKEKGYIYFPDFGVFYVIETNIRLNKHALTGEKMLLGRKKMLKWRACCKIKKYVKDMDAKIVY